MARVFYQIENYSTPEAGYRLLPFRFLRLDDTQEILVNEAGEFVVAPYGTVQALSAEVLHGDRTFIRRSRQSTSLLTAIRLVEEDDT